MSSRKGLLFILSAPSGTGKTVLLEALVKENPLVVRSISYTTREKREGEQEGIDYFFVTQKEFESLEKKHFFLESVTLFSASYGTSKSFVEEHLNKGHHVILVIDTQGALELKKRYEIPAIFLMPPSLEELERRLLKRGAESKKKQEERLSKATDEIALSKHYDYIVINDDLNVAKDVLKAIIIAEEHKVRNS
jgi:guanylate kinase